MKNVCQLSKFAYISLSIYLPSKRESAAHHFPFTSATNFAFAAFQNRRGAFRRPALLPWCLRGVAQAVNANFTPQRSAGAILAPHPAYFTHTLTHNQRAVVAAAVELLNGAHTRFVPNSHRNRRILFTRSRSRSNALCSCRRAPQNWIRVSVANTTQRACLTSSHHTAQGSDRRCGTRGSKSQFH